ncbi:MAG: hypothetical protein QNK92_15415 [Amylibacter sp.]
MARRKKTKSDSDTTYRYWIKLSYQAGQKRYLADTKIKKRIYRKLRTGNILRILYLPNAPHKIEAPIRSKRTKGRTIQIISGILGAAWLGLLWIVGRWTVFAVAARRKGRQLFAKSQGSTVPTIS